MIARSTVFCSRGDAETRSEKILRSLRTLREPIYFSQRPLSAQSLNDGGFAAVSGLRVSAPPREPFSAGVIA